MKKRVHLFLAILMSILFLVDCWAVMTAEVVYWYGIAAVVLTFISAFLWWLDVFKEDE